jgi:site-specific DNA recombinase
MRVVSYCRVSKAEQVEGYSLVAQRVAIERHCRDHDYSIVAYTADEGISGKHDSVGKRPGFKAALEMVESGRADAIAVHKLDRFARNARVFHDALHRVRNKIIFVADGIDPSTATGELMAGVMAQFAQFFSRNLGSESRKGLEQRRKEGLYGGGPLPFGVCKDPTATNPKKAPPIPDTAPAVCTVADRREWSRYDALRLLFERAAAGVSSIRISNELRDIGFNLTPPGVRHITLNRFYVGEIPLAHAPGSPHAVQWGPGAHSEIISRRLWQAANTAATSMPCLHRVKSVRKSAQTWSLTGMLTCGRCGGSIHIKSHADGTRAECASRYRLQRCDQPSFKLSRIEPQVAEVLAGYAFPEEIVSALEERLRPGRRDLRLDLRRLQGQRSRLNDLYIDGAISREQYAERSGRLQFDLAKLESFVPQREPVRFGKLLRDLPLMYEKADQEQRNRLLRLMFQGLMVDSYTITAVQPQPKLAALLGALPDNVETIHSSAFDGGSGVSASPIAKSAPGRNRL